MTTLESELNHLILVSFPENVVPHLNGNGFPVYTLTDDGAGGWDLDFEFNDYPLMSTAAEMFWDTGVPKDARLADDLPFNITVSGLATPPRAQTVKINRSGGGGGGTRWYKPSLSRAGKVVGYRKRPKGGKPSPWRKRRRL